MGRNKSCSPSQRYDGCEKGWFDGKMMARIHQEGSVIDTEIRSSQARLVLPKLQLLDCRFNSFPAYL